LVFLTNLVLQNAGEGITLQTMQMGSVSEGNANSLSAKAGVSKADLAAPKTTSAIGAMIWPFWVDILGAYWFSRALPFR
jgi:hypothetical protein